MTPLEIFGQLGNVCFFSRWIVQWVASERAGESRAPRAFFWLSLAGTLIGFLYTLQKDELLLLAGFAANTVFYGRLLALSYRPRAERGRLARTTLGVAVLAFFALLAWGAASGRNEAASPAWLVCGVVGQGIFGSRFAVQWWFSEVRGRSHFPHAFWWLSLLGNGFLLAYTLHTGDAVWIVGQVTAWIVPARNIWLDLRQRRAATDAVRA